MRHDREILPRQCVPARGLLLLLIATWTLMTGPAMAQNDLLVASPLRGTIERFDGFSGEYLGAIIGQGSGGLNRPGDIEVGPDGQLYVTSALTNEVLRYDGMTGEFLDVFVAGQGLSRPNNLTFFGGSLYVGNFASGTGGGVSRFDAGTGAFQERLVDADFVDGITFRGDSIFVSSFFGGVGQYDLATGELIADFASAGEGGLSNPTALLFNDAGELLVSSYSDNSVKRYSADGDYIDDVITGLATPEGLEFGLDGHLYAGSYTQGIINKYDRDTYELISQFASNGTESNFFTFRGPAMTIPEPTTWVPMGIVAALAYRRRKQRRRM